MISYLLTRAEQSIWKPGKIKQISKNNGVTLKQLENKIATLTSQITERLFRHAIKQNGRLEGLRFTCRSCWNNLLVVILVKLYLYSSPAQKCKVYGTNKSPPTTWNVLVCKDKPYFLVPKQRWNSRIGLILTIIRLF